MIDYGFYAKMSLWHGCHKELVICSDMAGFITKIFISIKENKVSVIIYIILLALLLDTNIRVRKLEAEGAFHYYNLVLDKIESRINDIYYKVSGL